MCVSGDAFRFGNSKSESEREREFRWIGLRGGKGGGL